VLASTDYTRSTKTLPRAKHNPTTSIAQKGAKREIQCRTSRGTKLYRTITSTSTMLSSTPQSETVSEGLRIVRHLNNIDIISIAHLLPLASLVLPSFRVVVSDALERQRSLSQEVQLRAVSIPTGCCSFICVSASGWRRRCRGVRGSCSPMRCTLGPWSSSQSSLLWLYRPPGIREGASRGAVLVGLR
jgi:hypothetical protein